jgi:UDP-N-acetylmuramyl pentapeptide synthase
MKTFVQKIIAWKAKKLIQQFQPKVVAVTGSVGKTSTRNAVAKVLEESFRVRTNPKNYNNEFGIPLTIIGVDESPGKSLLGWLKVFWKADKQMLFGNDRYPNVLVLEYACDGPGDIAYLCDIAQPDVSILTAISPVHAKNFGSLDRLIDEKATLIECVKSGGQVFMNADDEQVMGVENRAAAPVKTFGMQRTADVSANDVVLETREDFSFEPGERFSEIHFDLRHENHEDEVVLCDLLGDGQVSAALAAAAVGFEMGLELPEIKAQLAKLDGQPGRLRPIAGVKGTLVLDDSYNAAPASVRQAVEVLSRFGVREEDQRIAALGEMAELGQYSEDEHRKMGALVAEKNIDVLVAVGEKSRDYLRGAKDAGMDAAQMQYFEDSHEAGRWLDNNIDQGDIVLVKGSQSSRMEKAVKDIMAEPLRAGELLVRQYGKWVE